MQATPQRHWLVFQLLSLVIAALVCLAAWNRGLVWYENLAVPLCLALTPLVVRSAFLRSDGRPRIEQWVTKAWVAIVAAVVAEATNVALVLAHELDWPAVLPILILCAAIQVAAVVFLIYSAVRSRG